MAFYKNTAPFTYCSLYLYWVYIMVMCVSLILLYYAMKLHVADCCVFYLLTVVRPSFIQTSGTSSWMSEFSIS